LGRRSRKARRAGGQARTAPPAPKPVAAPERAPRPRGEARNQAVREGLEPLAAGERPVPVTIAAVVAFCSSVGNVVLLIVGVKIQGKAPAPFGVVLLAVILLVAAIGLWRTRYWAVLGFEALLAISLLTFSLALLKASNVLAVVIPLVALGLGGWLFYKLIRAMARIQMPRP
jgi:hypothetical protein